MAYLVKVAPKGKETEYITQKLQEYGYMKGKETTSTGLEERIRYAINWSQSFREIKEAKLKLTANETKAIKELVKALQDDADAEAIQAAKFNITRKHNIQPRQFFKKLYTILLGTPAGPRLGPAASARQDIPHAPGHRQSIVREPPNPRAC